VIRPAKPLDLAKRAARKKGAQVFRVFRLSQGVLAVGQRAPVGCVAAGLRNVIAAGSDR
jgi:hypothetical protein